MLSSHCPEPPPATASHPDPPRAQPARPTPSPATPTHPQPSHPDPPPPPAFSLAQLVPSQPEPPSATPSHPVAPIAQPLRSLSLTDQIRSDQIRSIFWLGPSKLKSSKIRSDQIITVIQSLGQRCHHRWQEVLEPVSIR
jgi:hypothetical protein